jgi:crotonobetainyl-CoA:carnitine CoA-transferase CaiB-like acyl-CoA transferase
MSTSDGVSAPGGGPLAGLRVLDLTRILAGPYATMVLGDLGADVIKVEPPEGDATRDIPPSRKGVSHYFLSVNRNKQSVVIDARKPAGRELLVELATRCDVVVENFRPGVATRLGVDYESVRARRADVVYCSISGFGQTGPWAKRSAFDIALQALSGAMSVTGSPGAPPVRLGIPIGDLSAGLFSAIGVLAAVAERNLTGEGQYVDVSMLESTVGLLGYLASSYFMTGESPERVGGGHHSIVPYGVFAASDGYLVLAGLTDVFWPKLCAAMERPDLAADPALATNGQRLARRGAVESIVGDVIRGRTVAEWCARLSAADVPHAPILSVGETLALEQLRVRGAVREAHHEELGPIQLLGPVIKFPRHGEAPASAPAALGADTTQVLHDLLGLDEARLRQLDADGVIPPVR